MSAAAEAFTPAQGEIATLKARIDLHDLAAKLDLQRPGGSGNYRSPHHADKSPSLSIYNAPDGQQRWKDWSQEQGGDCIDLVAFVEGCDKKQAIERLCELYAIPRNQAPPRRPAGEQSLAEYIADRCSDDRRLRAYLCEQRGIREQVVEAALQARSLGFNTWASSKVAAGEFGHGGPAAAFIVRSLNPGHIVAVDMRYLDAEANGGVKTQTQGEKHTHPWFSSAAALKRAQTIVLVESPINALSIESANLRHTAAVAIRGTGNASNVDLSFCAGRKVVVCMDCDAPDDKGRRAGLEAAWTLHERLTAARTGCLLVDQGEWYAAGWNDLNDVLREGGPDQVRDCLAQLEPWAIPGLPGRESEGAPDARRRIWLPANDFALYARYRVREDFTSILTTRTENGEAIEREEDLAGFRIVGLSRVTIQGATATMTGEDDAQPAVRFAASLQVPRHGPELQRYVVETDQLHNMELWRRRGPVFKPAQFSRLLCILERGVDIGAVRAMNFVGLAWLDRQPTVKEGADCYFRDPAKQCPYHGLSFPNGPIAAARQVIEGYTKTFAHHAATQLLCWALGAHLKCYLGFWPHMVLQADKGAGKSTLVKRLERTIAFKMFSGQNLQTEFRMLTSLSHTSHPVGWEELSAREAKVIDRAVALLQEAYQYTTSTRSSDMLEYLISAPVLLAGEDVPIRSLTGKVVRVDLTGRKGKLMDEDLPQFPVRAWLDHLAKMQRATVRERYDQQLERLQAACSASRNDQGAARMVGNYAAELLAAELLAEFAGLPVGGGFAADLIATMNGHITETSAEREPWVWIMETLLAEIDAGRYRYPFAFEHLDGVPCLLFRPPHAMEHIATSPGLRDRYNALSVKSAGVFKRQLARASLPAADGERLAVVVRDDIERRIPVRDHTGGVAGTRREQHLVAVSLDVLQGYGLTVGHDL